MSQTLASANIAAVIESLTGAMDRQQLLYQQLEKLLQREKMALIKGDGEQIATMTVEKRQLIQEIEELEGESRQQIGRCATALDLPLERNRLAALLPHCSPAQAQRLQELQRTLPEHARRLQFLSQINSALLQVSIDWLNQSLDTYTQLLRATLGGRQEQLAPAFVNIRI